MPIVPRHLRDSLSLPRLLLALQRGVWPLADQGLIAAASFATLIPLGRALTVDDFGAFTLVYAMLHFANSMQSGLITQPHNVLGAMRRGEDYVRYTSSTAVSQIFLAVLSAATALVAWIVAKSFGAGVAPLLLAAVPATVAWQCHEFLRRVLYTELRIGSAFGIDLIAYGGQMVGAAVLWHLNMLTGPTMMYLVGVACACGAVVGLWQLRNSLARHFDRSVVAENWHFGKWIAGGSIIGEWLSAQLLVFLAAAAMGAAAAGVLRAVHTMFGPTRILAQVFSITLPTRLARTLAGDGLGMFRADVRRTLLLAVPVLGAYCLLVATFARPLLTLVFGEKYREYGGVLALYAVSAFLTYIYMIGTAVLRAQRLTRPIFVSEVIYLLVVPIGALLIPVWGIYGVVVGLIVGDIVLLAFVWRSYLRAVRKDESATAPPESEIPMPATAGGMLP